MEHSKVEGCFQLTRLHRLSGSLTVFATVPRGFQMISISGVSDTQLLSAQRSAPHGSWYARIQFSPRKRGIVVNLRHMTPVY